MIGYHVHREALKRRLRGKPIPFAATHSTRYQPFVETRTVEIVDALRSNQSLTFNEFFTHGGLLERLIPAFNDAPEVPANFERLMNDLRQMVNDWYSIPNLNAYRANRRWGQLLLWIASVGGRRSYHRLQGSRAAASGLRELAQLVAICAGVPLEEIWRRPSNSESLTASSIAEACGQLVRSYLLRFYEACDRDLNLEGEAGRDDLHSMGVPRNKVFDIDFGDLELGVSKEATRDPIPVFMERGNHDEGEQLEEVTPGAKLASSMIRLDKSAGVLFCHGNIWNLPEVPTALKQCTSLDDLAVRLTEPLLRASLETAQVIYSMTSALWRACAKRIDARGLWKNDLQPSLSRFVQWHRDPIARQARIVAAQLETYTHAITDFARILPLAMQIARKAGRSKLPVLFHVSHHVSMHSRYKDTPKPPQLDRLTYWVKQRYLNSINGDVNIGFHFERYHPDILIPPIPSEMLSAKPTFDSNFILVDLNGSPFYLAEQCAKIDPSGDHEWRIYSAQQREVRKSTYPHIWMFPLSNSYRQKIPNARGALTVSGFMGPAELLHLGKPFVALPTPGHGEHAFNAATLQQISDVTVITSIADPASQLKIRTTFGDAKYLSSPLRRVGRMGIVGRYEDVRVEVVSRIFAGYSFNLTGSQRRLLT